MTNASSDHKYISTSDNEIPTAKVGRAKTRATHSASEDSDSRWSAHQENHGDEDSPQGDRWQSQRPSNSDEEQDDANAQPDGWSHTAAEEPQTGPGPGWQSAAAHHGADVVARANITNLWNFLACAEGVECAAIAMQ